MIGKQLQRHDLQYRGQLFRRWRYVDHVIGRFLDLFVTFRGERDHDSGARLHFLEIGNRLFVADHRECIFGITSRDGAPEVRDFAGTVFIEQREGAAGGDFAKIGVAASVQFTHAPSDEELAKRFWPDKLGGVYSFRSLLESGVLLANGSDAPVEELDPWAGVLAAVLRHWREDQRLTVEDALHATCVAPAWISHDERVRGTLLPGRAADLVVLDRDPLAIEPDELPEVQVVATMVAGRWVHNPPPWG